MIQTESKGELQSFVEAVKQLAEVFKPAETDSSKQKISRSEEFKQEVQRSDDYFHISPHYQAIEEIRTVRQPQLRYRTVSNINQPKIKSTRSLKPQQELPQYKSEVNYPPPKTKSMYSLKPMEESPQPSGEAIYTQRTKSMHSLKAIEESPQPSSEAIYTQRTIHSLKPAEVQPQNIEKVPDSFPNDEEFEKFMKETEPKPEEFVNIPEEEEDTVSESGAKKIATFHNNVTGIFKTPDGKQNEVTKLQQEFWRARIVAKFIFALKLQVRKVSVSLKIINL